MKFVFIKVVFIATVRGIVSEVLGGEVYTRLGSAASFEDLSSVNNHGIWPSFFLSSCTVSLELFEGLQFTLPLVLSGRSSVLCFHSQYGKFLPTCPCPHTAVSV